MTEKSLLVEMAGKYNMPAKSFYQAVKRVMPDGVTDDQMQEFLSVAHRYGLDPITKEIHATLARGKIVPVVGIDGWVSIARKTGELAAIKLKDQLDDNHNIIATTAEVYRKNEQIATEVTEYMPKRRPNAGPWQQYPERMLHHKATIQALRYAFGISGIYDEEEAKRIAQAYSDAPSGKDKLASLDGS